MPSYTTGFRAEVVRKILSSNRTDSIVSISEQAGVPVRTTRRWVRRYQKQLPLNAYLSDERKMNAVLETLNMPIEVKSVFCRTNGILVEELNEWEMELKTTLSGGAVSRFEYRKLKAEKDELKKLLLAKEKELIQKDKALVEACALLELQKKIQTLLEKEGLNLSES